MHNWQDIFANETPDNQADYFHEFLRKRFEFYFPEKEVKISTLDKKWFSPQLKQLHRRMQRAFHKNRSSQKYKMLKQKFKKMKRKSMKSFYNDFVLGKKIPHEAKQRVRGNDPSKCTQI